MKAKKTAKRTAKKSQVVNILFGMTGADPTAKKVTLGVTKKDIIERWSLQGLNVLVNGTKVADDYQFGEGDRVSAIAAVKGA
jgi:hypothetical protein